MEAEGRVRPGWGMRPTVSYRPTARDLSRLAEASLLMAKLMLRAGALEVYPGIASLPTIVRNESELPSELAAPRLSDFRLVASHLFGTARAGHRGLGGVVDERLEVYGFPDLYVMDASVFPTNLGVNPQHSIMSVAWSAATRLAAGTAGKAPRLALL